MPSAMMRGVPASSQSTPERTARWAVWIASGMLVRSNEICTTVFIAGSSPCREPSIHCQVRPGHVRGGFGSHEDNNPFHLLAIDAHPAHRHKVAVLAGVAVGRGPPGS